MRLVNSSSMRGAEAKEVCPEIQLVQVSVFRGKADLNGYRNAGSEVVSILSRSGRCERASIDEVYFDLIDAAETMLAENPPQSLETIDEEALKSHIIGLNYEDGSGVKENVRKWINRHNADHHDKLLACGILIVAELRMRVFKETKFTLTFRALGRNDIAFESTVRRPGKAPVGAVPSPSPGRHAATYSRRGSSSSSAPAVDGFETGTPCRALKANLFPEVTDPFCRLPLPTLFHRPEAVESGREREGLRRSVLRRGLDDICGQFK
ncbi:DNA polymerase eta-like [Hibiscus syriacus]|uniref:DNA polymerase eta-like n=1 Tax=Hibiscus syriacus TaxID=106335 RepID=UPI001923600E|nr:DNA polymerase eta-like [Hibiscus syriacus]